MSSGLTEYDFSGSGKQGAGVFFDALQGGVVLGGSTTQFHVKDAPNGLNLLTFHGTFIANNGVIQSGTITGFDAYYTPANHLLETSGYSIDVVAFMAALAVYSGGGDPTPLFQLLLGPPMTVNGSDVPLGLGNPEILIGGLSADHLFGNAGNDQIFDYGGGSDFIFGGLGDDLLFSDGLFFGGVAGGDFIFGGEGDDRLGGGGGDDFLSGGSGLDELDGDDGSDTADYSEKVDNLALVLDGPNEVVATIGGFVEDRLLEIENINAGSGNDALIGDSLINRLVGNDGDDRLVGNGGNDALFGEAGNDRIKGGADNDDIGGGDGNDKLRGGAGRDEFFFASKPGGANSDRVFDFSHAADTIVLDDVVFDKAGFGKLKAKFFQVGGEALDASDRIIYDDVTGVLYFDRDGTGVAAQQRFAQLSPGLVVTADDFLIV